MLGIEWPPISTYVPLEPSQFLEPLRAIVTVFAQALHVTHPERIPIAFVRHDVVADRRHPDTSNLGADRTQRMLCKLMLGASLPSVRCVPRTRVVGVDHASTFDVR